ncbi:MAG: hypothetical protein ACLR2E_09815 [Lachnospiraceae bacterium]
MKKRWYRSSPARTPTSLCSAHEVLDILTVAKMVLYASLARKSSSAPLCFTRSDYPEMDPRRIVTISRSIRKTARSR